MINAQNGVSTSLSSYVPPAPMASPMPVDSQAAVSPMPLASSMPVADNATSHPKPIAPLIPSATTSPVIKQIVPPMTTTRPPSPAPTPTLDALLAKVNDFVQNKLPQLTGGLEELMTMLGTLTPQERQEALKRPEVQAKIKSLAKNALDQILLTLVTPEELAAIKNYLDIARQLAGGNGYLGGEDIDKIARATSDPNFMAAMLRSGLFDDQLVRPGLQGTNRGDRRGNRRANLLANRMTVRPNGLISRVGGRIVYNMTRSQLAAVLQQMGVNLSSNFPKDNTMLQLDPQQITQALMQQSLMTQMAARLQAQLAALKAELAAQGVDFSQLGLGNPTITFPNGIPIPPSLDSILNAALNGQPLPPPLNSPGQLLNNIQIKP